MKNTKLTIESQSLFKNNLLKKTAFLLTLFLFVTTVAKAQPISDGGNYTVGGGGYS